MILILKTGGTFPEYAAQRGDFEDWTIAGTGLSPKAFVVADGMQVPLPEPARLRGVIITGSHSMVTDGGPELELWSSWLRRAIARQLPVLGICYGHQLLAHTLGGRVDWHPGGLEIGQVEVTLTEAATEDVLFQNLPKSLSVYATHRQSVVQLPPDTVVLGGNPFEPHHAVRFAPKARGVQFHPEFDATAMRHYIRHQRPHLQSDSAMQHLLDAVAELPDRTLVLRRFCALCHQAS
ncbi:MAG: glutamine amidotransferase [Geothermobacteraceae bacterium]